MGWYDCHLHEFNKGNKRYGTNDEDGWGTPVIEEDTIYISDVLKKKRDEISYTYDFGGSWEHTISVIEIEPETVFLSVCTDGARKCPPEDIGGVFGFQEFLEIMTDPKHEEYEQFCEWNEGPFNPEEFDLKELNLSLGHE